MNGLGVLVDPVWPEYWERPWDRWDEARALGSDATLSTGLGLSLQSVSAFGVQSPGHRREDPNAHEISYLTI